MKKKSYAAPQVELIVLDNEISLALESLSPPPGPSEGLNKTPDYLDNNPFKNQA